MPDAAFRHSERSEETGFRAFWKADISLCS